MENKEITKTFPVAETFLASWRYCRENRRHIAVFTLVNWLLLLLGFKFMGGTGNILFIFWCVLYYLFSCFFFRFYYNRRPYLLTHKIFDSLVPSTKILFLTLALATLLAYLPFAPLFLGFPAEMMEDYAVVFIQEYMDENKLYDMGLALVLLLVSPIIFFRPMMAWISSVIGRSGSLRNAWRRTKGNYLRFLAVVFLFNAAAYLVQEADVLSGADSWLAWTLLAPLIIYCNVFLAKSFDFFFLDLDTE